jgi:HAD superfamily hydrolase (TIGR01509 family)
MAMPDLVIFDCDGVLVDSEVISNRVLAANLTRAGLAMTAAQAMGLFVGGTMASVGDVARDMGGDLGPNWLPEVYAEIYAALAKGTPVIAGVPQLLDRLDTAKLHYAVASNGSLEKMQITLGQNGLWHRFEGARFSAHALGVAKPDPGLFLAAAAAFDVAPDQCVVIEDSATGVRAAMAAEMRCLGYAPEGDHSGLGELGAEIFATMGALPGHLGMAAD